MQVVAAVVARAFRHTGALALGSALCAGALPVQAVEIYRCPGPPVVYTSDLHLVRAGHCLRLGAAAVIPVASTTAAAATTGRAAPAGNKIAAHVQQQRDADRVHILQSEVARERDRLARLTQQLQQLQSTPAEAAARQSEVMELAQAIQRSESDLQALDKELARVPR